MSAVSFLRPEQTVTYPVLAKPTNLLSVGCGVWRSGVLLDHLLIKHYKTRLKIHDEEGSGGKQGSTVSEEVMLLGLSRSLSKSEEWQNLRLGTPPCKLLGMTKKPGDHNDLDHL